MDTLKQQRRRVEEIRLQRLKDERRKAKEMQIAAKAECERIKRQFIKSISNHEESLEILLNRVEFGLKRSGYENWVNEFYVPAIEEALSFDADIFDKEVSGRKKKQQAETDEKTAEMLKGMKILYQGVLLTHEQIQFLKKHPKTKKLDSEATKLLCAKLGETIPLFAEFVSEERRRFAALSPELQEVYDFIGLTPQTLTEESLQQRFRAKAHELHPDRNPSATAADDFLKLQHARKVLKDEILRFNA